MILDPVLHDLLVQKLKKLNQLRPISSTMMKKLRERFEIEMTYNSNAIEGNTLTLKETYWVIQEGMTFKGKPLKDHLEAKNHKEALNYLYDLIQEKNHTFSEHLIKTLHTLILEKIDQNIAGQYRQIEVMISGASHRPPSALDVPLKMHDLIEWTRDQQEKMNIIEFSAIFHHKFVHTHPFEDGNGRTGRLLMNVFLMRHGLPLVIIQKNDREKYYRTLHAADKGDYKPLVKLVAQATLRSLNIYLDVLTPTAKKTEWFKSVSEIALETPYSAAYLGKLAKLGKIDAHKEGRNWLTTKQAIENYIKSRKK